MSWPVSLLPTRSVISHDGSSSDIPLRPRSKQKLWQWQHLWAEEPLNGTCWRGTKRKGTNWDRTHLTTNDSFKYRDGCWGPL